MNAPQIQMPKYTCHKEVWALKIKSVNYSVTELKNEVTLHFEDEGYAPIVLDSVYWVKHNPQAGGYYVVYPDGYKSFSPAAAFESGYTLTPGS